MLQLNRRLEWLWLAATALPAAVLAGLGGGMASFITKTLS
jgi:hypothetical protein